MLAFIDYEKAFASIIHDKYWIKLVESGFSCNMLDMIKPIYTSVMACIRISHRTFSDVFPLA